VPALLTMVIFCTFVPKALMGPEAVPKSAADPVASQFGSNFPYRRFSGASFLKCNRQQRAHPLPFVIS
jgi:hypothetical protein